MHVYIQNVVLIILIFKDATAIKKNLIRKIPAYIARIHRTVKLETIQ